jgi:hypothetical protein
MDPLMFNDGLQFVWRIGDAVDASGIKCMIADNNGRPAGNPQVVSSLLLSCCCGHFQLSYAWSILCARDQVSTVTAYTWVYTW